MMGIKKTEAIKKMTERNENDDGYQKNQSHQNNDR